MCYLLSSNVFLVQDSNFLDLLQQCGDDIMQYDITGALCDDSEETAKVRLKYFYYIERETT